MTDRHPPTEFQPPRAEINVPGRTKQPRTVGYLVGAIVQLFVGGSWAYGGIANSHVLSGVIGGGIFTLRVCPVAPYRRLPADGTARTFARRVTCSSSTRR